jgi:hypothetical protein
MPGWTVDGSHRIGIAVEFGGAILLGSSGVALVLARRLLARST